MCGISVVIAARRAGVAVYRTPAMVHERVIAPGSSSVRYSTACGSAPEQSSRCPTVDGTPHSRQLVSAHAGAVGVLMMAPFGVGTGKGARQAAPVSVGNIDNSG